MKDCDQLIVPESIQNFKIHNQVSGQDDISSKVSQYFNAKHKSRGRLIRSTFDAAATHFEDNTIDLIHIDGLHTYEAVKHDYKTWLSKLKEGGTLMFHDWNVREADFGVWRLWEEIKASGNFQCIEIKFRLR